MMQQAQHAALHAPANTACKVGCLGCVRSPVNWQEFNCAALCSKGTTLLTVLPAATKILSRCFWPRPSTTAVTCWFITRHRKGSLKARNYKPACLPMAKHGHALCTCSARLSLLLLLG
jgi:hypothetical protein